MDPLCKSATASSASLNNFEVSRSIVGTLLPATSGLSVGRASFMKNRAPFGADGNTLLYCGVLILAALLVKEDLLIRP